MRHQITKIGDRLKAVEYRRQQGKTVSVSGTRCIRSFIAGQGDPYLDALGPPIKGTGDTCVRWLLFKEEGTDDAKFTPVEYTA